MANKDLKLIQQQTDGSFLEVNITPVAGQALGFDASKDPASTDARGFNIDGGDAVGNFAQIGDSPIDGGDATSF